MYSHSAAGYNPWLEAAAYGQALGDSLGRAMIQLPNQRLQHFEEAQRFPLEQKLLQAQIANQEYMPEFRRQGLEFKQQQEADRMHNAGEVLDLKTRLADQKLAYDTDMIAIRKLMADIAGRNAATGERRAETYQQNADTRADMEERGKPMSSAQVDTRAARALELAPGIAASVLPTVKEKDVKGSPEMLAALSDAAKRPGDLLSNIMATISPELVTNTPAMSKLPLIGQYFSGAPVVSTNGVKWTIPSGGPTAVGGGIQPQGQAPVQAQEPTSSFELIAHAIEAVNKGADPKAVKARMQAYGLNPDLLPF